MQKFQGKSFALLPETAVELVKGERFADWWRLESKTPIKAGRWVRLRYRSSIFEDNIRPLIRFDDGLDEGPVQPMNGTLFGVGEWIGFVPAKTSKISISPAARSDATFAVERLDYLSSLRLMARGALSNPGWIGWMLHTRVLGAHSEAQRALKIASSSTAFTAYDVWHRRLSRPVDLAGIDRPRADWNKTARFRLLLSVDVGELQTLRPTIHSLSAQLYPRWSLHCLIRGRNANNQAEADWPFADDPRISAVNETTDLRQIAPDYADSDFCAVISAGDILPDYALGAVAEALDRHPSATVLYGDEDSISRSGKLHSPVLRPDWSPYFQAEASYIGPMTFVRCGDLCRQRVSIGQFVSENDRLVAVTLAGSARDSVHHIRRVLYRRRREFADLTEQTRASQPARSATSVQSQPGDPTVTVVVLTRDNPACLAECIEGLTSKTDYPGLNIILVDTGSVDSAAHELLREFRKHSKITVLDRPGPFNFAALCNEAAHASQASVLVFVNDDVEVRDRDWLKPLVSWAMRPDVGIVGAKLLFPNGRIQHAGVVVGLGGIAAHEYRGQNSSVGYLGRLRAAHEVGAVTAACIAVERKKFEAAGGFDAASFPVDLNDIDLCLRLAERGYATIWTPESVLIHHESMTRGRTPWSPELYRAERTIFVARWQATIRDDKFFHPDLSLFSYRPALA